MLTHKPAADIFFLCFIPQGCELYEPDSAKRMALRTRTSEEHDCFIEYLEANGAEEIYSMYIFVIVEGKDHVLGSVVGDLSLICSQPLSLNPSMDLQRRF